MTPKASNFRGVYSAIATPLKENGSIDVAAFVAHARALLAEGCDALAPLGTTGEANSFGIAERKALIEDAVNAGFDPALLMPGTGLTNLPDTIDLTRHAVELGVAATLLLPPFYYEDATEDGLFSYFAGVVEGVQSADLRVILYHIPQMTGVPITAPLLRRLVDAFPGTFVGVKDSAGDLTFTQQLIEAFPELSILAGSDRHLWPVLQLGGGGCITASSNLIASELRFIANNWRDAARADAIARTQQRIEAWRNIVISNPQTAAVKLMLSRRRGSLGWNRLRLPMTPLGNDAGQSVLIEMTRLEDLALMERA